MGEFAGAVEGMAEACTALAFPVVSGNVSLYNETNGVAIPPTPAIGGIGLIPDIAMMATIALKREGDVLMLLGEEAGHLGQSLYMQVMLNRTFGAPPPVDLDAERRTGDLVQRADPKRGAVGGARRVGRRAVGGNRRDGSRRRSWRRARRGAKSRCPRMPSGSARTRPAMSSPLARQGRRHPQGGGRGQSAAQAARNGGRRRDRARRRARASLGRAQGRA